MIHVCSLARLHQQSTRPVRATRDDCSRTPTLGAAARRHRRRQPPHPRHGRHRRAARRPCGARRRARDQAHRLRARLGPHQPLVVHCMPAQAVRRGRLCGGLPRSTGAQRDPIAQDLAATVGDGEAESRIVSIATACSAAPPHGRAITTIGRGMVAYEAHTVFRARSRVSDSRNRDCTWAQSRQ